MNGAASLNRVVLMGVLAAILATGCDQGLIRDAAGKAAATKAASLLKQYQVGQNLYQLQFGEGRYGSLSELASRGLVNTELANAWDRQPGAQAVSGYLFADIEYDESGAPLNRAARAGLCAYPAGGSGDVILMLLDVNDAAGWAYYSAPSAAAGGAVRQWPAAANLSGKFARGRQYTPQQAVAEARKLADQAKR